LADFVPVAAQGFLNMPYNNNNMNLGMFAILSYFLEIGFPSNYREITMK